MGSWLNRNTIILGLSLLFSCGEKDSEKNPDLDVVFSLERTYTGKNQNTLLLDTANPEKFTFSISGEGFESDIQFGENTPLQPSTILSYQSEGSYDLYLKIIRDDGVTFVDRPLKWFYSRKVPPIPKINLENPNTSTGLITLLIPTDLSVDIKELSIAGDLSAHSSGAWVQIPKDLKINQLLSSKDGQKTLKVKYRNIYGNEGPVQELTAFKKSQGPLNCKAELPSTTVHKQELPLFLSAENEGVMRYRIAGDVETTEWKEFENETETEVLLLAGKGKKNILVSMQDIAENRCPDISLEVTLDPDYPPYEIFVEGKKLWTDSLDINLFLRYDHLPNEPIQMYISGKILPSEDTNAWVPFKDKVALQLSPVDGHRFIYAEFRDSEGIISDKAYVGIYLKPFVRLQTLPPQSYVQVSHFSTLENLSINGCQQSYKSVAYQSLFPCNPLQDRIEVSFLLNDGSVLTRSTNSE